MKRILALLIAALLALPAVSMQARASDGYDLTDDGWDGGGTVVTTGNVNIRVGPGLDYGIIGSVGKGYTLSYAGETRYDERPVAWYRVHYKGGTGWISSRYALLRDDGAAGAGSGASGMGGGYTGAGSALPGGGSDQESSLRQSLSGACGKTIQYFGYADYDGDGRFEAFAIVGSYNEDEWDNMGELWYVSSDTVQVLEQGKGYYPDQSEITTKNGIKCFKLEEGYFGSGGYVRFWTVVRGKPRLYCEQGVWFSQDEITGEEYYDIS